MCVQRARWSCVLFGLLLVAAAPLLAGDLTGNCRLANQPAATLLVPYFEVDLANPAGRTTLVSINNAAPRPTLARMVLWTDWGVPTLAFDVYLTGYDVQTFNLRDVFNGNLPQTGPAISPTGPLSMSGPGFPGCSGASTTARAVSSGQQLSLRAAHTGQALPNSQPAQCAASPRPKSSVVIGYITVDSVNRCTGASVMSAANTPADPAYFAKGGTGLANDLNVLWGDVFYLAAPARPAMSQPAVTIVADAQFFNPGDYTFYGRYDNFDSRDDRMPLSSMYDVRFFNGGAFSSGTELLVWRDNRSAEAGALPCGSTPSWAAPGEEQLVTFDEQENASALSKPNAFPLTTQRVKVGGATLPTQPSAGWLMLDLWHADGTHAQGWVGSLLTASGRFSSGHEA
ncbi:MAG: hypothetical protein JOZ15_13835, partial [Acidobacteria bacterium]|nr:hypothetical protein [Acidobacteriota bacterium]